MLCLTQGKSNSLPVRAGIVCQGKYLGSAFEMVNLFLYETVMKRLLNVFLGKNECDYHCSGGRAGAKTRCI